MKVVFIGLSVTSSWGNGHATNYRGLMRALTERGHEVAFLERDVPWYASQRDLPDPPWGTTHLYSSLDELRERFAGEVAGADLCVLGSYVPDGVAAGDWMLGTARGVTAFYDIDTPVTLAKLEAGDTEYLAPELVPRFDLYLSFTGGPTLDLLRARWGARSPHAFYCLVDPGPYRPLDEPVRWDLGYLGTYSDDRQPPLERLLLAPARAREEMRFCVAGPQYPDSIEWPPNVERMEHVPPAEHPAFYAAQRFTLNVTRAAMVRAGWSPSVRLFEAAACAVPVISDRWAGLGDVFEPGREILIADGPDEVVRMLTEIDEDERRAIGERARERVLREHTAERRVEQLEELVTKGQSLLCPHGASA
jgi:spore maturation protein CgeB